LRVQRSPARETKAADSFEKKWLARESRFDNNPSHRAERLSVYF
jgi:hypothetical protein